MIGLFGLNHKSAPIEIREKFVFCEEDVKRFVPQLKSIGIRGAVVVSTCNRTEIYFDQDDKTKTADFDLIGSTLMNYRKVASEVRVHFYQMKNEEAVQHLFRVVSGPDSMALGDVRGNTELPNSAKLHTFPEAVALLYKNKVLAHTLLNCVTGLSIEYAPNQVKRGVCAFLIFETHAGLIPADLYFDMIMPYVRKISSAVMQQGCPVIFLPKGIGTGIAHLTPRGHQFSEHRLADPHRRGAPDGSSQNRDPGKPRSTVIARRQSNDSGDTG